MGADPRAMAAALAGAVYNVSVPALDEVLAKGR